MLNHAAEVNRKRMDLRINERRRLGQLSDSEQVLETTVNGRKLTEMTSDELLQHHGGEGPRPKVIKTKKKE
jgi:hypothetical protein